MSRPTLLPGLRLLWRDRHHLQAGTDPERALILEFPVPAVAGVLALLDGSRTEQAVHRDATALGIPPQATTDLLTSLSDAGLVVGAHTLLPGPIPESLRQLLAPEVAGLALQPTEPDPDTPPASLTPAQALRRRAAARVLIRGSTRISATLAATLTASGVGQVAVDVAGQATVADSSIGGLTPADSGRPRAAAAADAVLRAAPGAVVGPLPPHRATFVVQVGQEQPARLAALAAARRRVPTLAVDIRDAVAVVGPLVPATGAPCLNCLDLHRQDHDRAWPQLAAQLVSAPETPLACTVATALAAAAYAAHQVLAWLDGRATETLGATVEISTPGRHRRRTWPPHRGCDCSQAGRRQHQRDG